MPTETLYVLDAAGVYRPAQPTEILAEAKRCIAAKARRGAVLESPDKAKDLLQLELFDREHEVFGCLFLNQRHRLIERIELFRGTIDSANVYPREVVKAALQRNAAAVAFYHNHPSGEPDPSEADKLITQRLKAALQLIDIRVLDQFVIGAEKVYSFAEAGLL